MISGNRLDFLKYERAQETLNIREMTRFRKEANIAVGQVFEGVE